jgi:hypothetical protein
VVGLNPHRPAPHHFPPVLDHQVLQGPTQARSPGDKGSQTWGHCNACHLCSLIWQMEAWVAAGPSLTGTWAMCAAQPQPQQATLHNCPLPSSPLPRPLSLAAAQPPPWPGTLRLPVNLWNVTHSPWLFSLYALYCGTRYRLSLWVFEEL